MQPLKITIPGKFWDSHIYSGKLYLFLRNGELRSIDWDRLVEEWPLPEQRLRLAMTCAFKRSDYLYGEHLPFLFHDKEIKDVLFGKFADLSRCELELTDKRQELADISRQDSPFPFPHIDCEIYSGSGSPKMYISSTKGIHAASCGRSNLKHGVSTRPRKLWDCPVLSVSGSYSTLALAAGSEGLYELPLNKPGRAGRNTSEDPYPVADRDCTGIKWTYYSLYGCSHLQDGFLADYKNMKVDDLSHERQLQTIIDEEEIFGHTGYSWGYQDKIYLCSDNSIQVARYSPWDRDNSAQVVKYLGEITLRPWKGNVVDGGVAMYGTIVECDNALVVLPSEGETMTLDEEPVNWRVFPRSKHYENHLHVIYEDRLEIWSFNHDYFVDQDEKLAGVRRRQNK